MRLTLVVLFLLLVPQAGPTGEAQQPVTGCTQQCDPRAPDVNKGVATAGPVNVLLYLHLEKLIDRGMINAQPPNPAHENDLNAGWIVPIVRTNTSCQQCNLRFENNKFDFQLCGPIHFTKHGWNADCGHDPLPGISLVGGDQIILYWYMSANAMPPNGGSSAPAKASVMPHVGVAARLNAGTFGRGPVVAESEPPSPTGGSRITMITRPGADDVYEFRTPMRIRIADLFEQVQWDGKSHSIGLPLHLRVEFYQIHTGPGSENQFAQADWRVRTGPAFKPRLVVPMLEPLRLADAFIAPYDSPMEASARFGVFAGVGHYDVDQGNATFEIEGPGGAKPLLEPVIIRKGYDGHSYPRPLNFTLPLNFSEAPPGEYKVRFSVPNQQGTYRLHAEARFIWGGVAEDAPGPGLAWLFVLALVVGLARHRSRPS